MEADYLLKNGLLFPVTSQPIRGNIIIKDGEIKEINQKNSLNDYEGRVIDLENKAVLPGLINTHTHLSMTLFRGMADELELNEWLKKLRPLESKIDEEDIYAGAQLGCLEMLKNGITCFSDMYFHMDQVVKAVKETGIRANLGYGMVTIDKDEERSREELNKGIEFYNKYVNEDKLIDPFIAPHSITTCSIDFLEKISKLDINEIQMHIAETKEEFRKVKKEHQKTPIELLNNLGLLQKNFLAAHGVHLGKKDLEIIGNHNVSVSYNPSSNMKLASGVAPVKKMNQMGVNVSLGTDGAASNNSLDILQEMKIGSLLQKIANKDAAALRAHDVLKMATINGARSLNKEDRVGSIEEGKKADLIIVDLKKPSLNPLNNLVSNVVYSATGEVVESVMVNGEFVVQDNELQKKDQNEILKKANKRNKELKEELSDE